LLAFRAVMAAAPCNHHTLDRSLTHLARFAFSSINSVLQLEKSFLAISIHVVRDGRAAKLDRLRQDFTHGKIQTPKVLPAERGRAPSGPNSRPKQRFVRINVPHTTQQFLI